MSNKLLEIETDLVVPFKTLFELLKDILNDTNIEIVRDDDKNMEDEPNNGNNDKDKNTNDDNAVNEENPEGEPVNDTEENGIEAVDEIEDEHVEKTEEKPAVKIVKDEKKPVEKDNSKWGGMKIIAMDNTKTLLINVKLDASKFTVFKCKKKSLDIGINLGQFYKLIKTLDKEETLKMYINNDDRQNLKLHISNNVKNYESIYKLKLMDRNKSNLKIPQTTFDSIITIDTGEFHKVCREMSQLADYIEIKCTRNTLTFTCKGDCVDRSTTYYPNKDNGIRIKFNENAPDIVQGIFELRYIVMFTKCSNICTDIQILGKNNYPLCINYTVATLGRILFCLSPVAEDVISKDFQDDDGYYEDTEIKIKKE